MQLSLLVLFNASAEASSSLISCSASHTQPMIEELIGTNSSQRYSLVSGHAGLMVVLADGSSWRKRQLI